jgi:amino-acid N-acetyltransferase
VEVSIERARREDLEAVRRLLRASFLPVEGLTDWVSTTLVARRDGAVIGSAALETYGDGVLLRSVAVDSAMRREAVGRRLVEAAIDLSRELRAPAIYLLTTTAERYFPNFGFERIDRAEVPTGVQASVEFTSACPSSATVMRRWMDD